MSIALATVSASTAQIGLPGRDGRRRADSELKVLPPGLEPTRLVGAEPAWPVRTTAKDHPVPGVPPSAALGTVNVIHRVTCVPRIATVPTVTPRHR